jgi:hypothetical protein
VDSRSVRKTPPPSLTTFSRNSSFLHTQLEVTLKSFDAVYILLAQKSSFEVLTAMTVKSMIPCVATPCSLVEVHQRLERTYPPLPT